LLARWWIGSYWTADFASAVTDGVVEGNIEAVTELREDARPRTTMNRRRRRRWTDAAAFDGHFESSSEPTSTPRTTMPLALAANYGAPRLREAARDRLRGGGQRRKANDGGNLLDSGRGEPL